ncbi:MAG: MFS transporter [Ruminococcaceae bacterium]|nr:MFS transporter [Oscillospiraceae bacterium]
MEQTKSYTRLKLACYTTNVSMSVVGNLSPILFLTFHNLYDISYSLLGLLVLINFFTQLTIDLIFSFFSHKFNIPLAVKLTPFLTFIGLLVYAVLPYLFPDAVYAGLVIGTIIFSCSGGLAEVLISPVIAAIPAKDPDREMSRLHSVYAWGVVGVIFIATLFLLAFGQQHWQILALLFMLVPLSSCILFSGASIPDMGTQEKVSGVLRFLKNKALWLCFAAIFLGGAAECTMAQWASGYLEQALGIPKVWGDIFGVALFSVMLGLGRTLYSKYGRRISSVLLLGGIGASVCYLTAALVGIPVIGLLACGFTGFCVSMLWPGSLIVASDRIPDSGVFIYAMMASGGDLGASVGPQLIGLITDAAIASPTLSALASDLSLAPEQLGMKLGMLVGALFPLAAIPVYLHIDRTAKKE